MRIFVPLILLLLVSIFDAQAKEKWILPIPDHVRPPFSYQTDQGYQGIFVDLMQEVAQRIDVVIEEKTYPIVRRRELFVRGDLVITCCVNPVWRDKPEEKAVQLFSDPIYNSREMFLFPPQKAFPIPTPEALQNKTVVTIKGFNYLGEEHFGARLDVRDPEQIVHMVARGRGDVGLLQYEVAKYHAAVQGVDIIIGPIHHAAPLHIRLHKSKAAHMVKINKAIAEMKANGIIKQIFEKYMVGN